MFLLALFPSAFYHCGGFDAKTSYPGGKGLPWGVDL